MEIQSNNSTVSRNEATATRTRKSLLMILFPIVVIAINYWNLTIPEIGLAGLFVFFGLLISLGTLIVTLVIILLPHNKVRTASLSIVAVVALLSMVPGLFFRVVFLGANADTERNADIQEVRNGVLIANWMVVDIRQYKRQTGSYPADFDEFFSKTSFHQANPSDVHLRQINYLLSDDHASFLIYTTLPSEKYRNSDFDRFFRGVHFVTTPTLGINCAQKTIVCIQ